MSHQRPLLLLMLIIYIFSPTLFSWVIAPNGVWYRPYLLWILVIIVAYIVQGRDNKHDI